MNWSKALLIVSIILLSLNSCYRKEARRNSATTVNSHKTWCDVQYLFNNVCGRCHHTGGIGPFSLLTYNDVYNRSATIAAVLKAGIMPPWRPDTSYSHFMGEFVISEQERQLVIDWIEAGAKGCDTAQPAKEYSAYTNQSQIGEPDTSLPVQQYRYEIPENNDHYQNFIVQLPWKEVRYATAIEVIPENGQAIHHISAFLVTDTARLGYLKRNKIWKYSMQEEPEKFPQLLSNWAKGSFAFKTPDSIGIKLPANAVLSVQIHYSSGYKGIRDSSHINFFLNKKTPTREHKFEYINNLDLHFAPNEVKYEQVVKHIDSAITLTSIWPHTHHLAQNALCFALTPAGDTIRLLKINNWSYDWQSLYVFPKPVVIPAGSDIIMKCLYDNTNRNERNPFNPPRTIKFGINVTDEMLVLNYYYMKYQKGDENLNPLISHE